jgi:hypothetical protein
MRAPGCAGPGVGQCRDLDLGLPDADRFDQDDIASGRVEHPNGLRCGGGKAAQVAPGGHGADINALVHRVVLHPDPVTQQCAAGERR